MPGDIALTKLQRYKASIAAKNVLVVYDTSNTSGIDATATALAYQAARSIPAANMLPLNFDALSGVTHFWNALSCTKAQLQPITAAISTALLTSTNDLKVIVIVGDVPYRLSDLTWNGTWALSTFDALAKPNLFKNWPDLSPFRPDSGTGNWADNPPTSPYYSASIPKWYFDVDARYINCWYNPDMLTSTTDLQFLQFMRYPVFNFPLIPFVGNTHAKVSDLWKKAIAAEFKWLTNWGTCLLAPGTTQNSTSRQFYEEQLLEGIDQTNTFWSGFNVAFVPPRSVTETGQVLYTNALPDKDPHNWTQTMKGDPGFTPGTRVFVRSQGLNNYYSLIRCPEVFGDYVYDEGAICIHSQSFGATPGPQFTVVDPNAATTVLVASGPTAIYKTGSVLTAANVTVNTVSALEFLYTGPQSDGVTVESTVGSITVKQGAATIFTTTTAGRTPLQFFTQLNADAIGSGLSGLVAGVTGLVYAARCYCSIANGATVAIGCSTEPTANGDPTTYGLVTQLWYGGNLGEWYNKLTCTYQADNTVIENPVGWVIYGDPLYRPFGYRASFYNPSQIGYLV